MREEENFGMRGKGGKKPSPLWGKNGNFFWGGISLKERGENTYPSKEVYSIRRRKIGNRVGQLWQPFENRVGKLFLSSRNFGKGGK